MVAKSGSRPLKKKVAANGIVHVSSTFNGTIVSLTDVKGDVLCWASSGSVGFKGARPSTPYAAQLAAESVATKGKAMGMRNVDLYIKGPGAGRESALRALQGFFEVTSIRDVTPMPHNGCRLPKRPRN